MKGEEWRRNPGLVRKSDVIVRVWDERRAQSDLNPGESPTVKGAHLNHVGVLG